MKLSELKKYISLFILAVAIIAVYKTFDNISVIFEAIGLFFSILSPIIYAFVIAFLLYPLCVKCEKFTIRKMPVFFKKRARMFSVLAVYIIVVVIIGGIIYAMLPSLIKSITEFIKMIPTLIDNISESINNSKYISINASDINKYIDIPGFLKDNLDLGSYTSKIMSISENFINIIFSLIMSVYILLDRKSLYRSIHRLLKLFSSKSEKYGFLRKYGKKAIDFSYKYFYCVLIDSVIMFAISLIVLLTMRIEYASVLALMLGIFNIVPYFGALIACIIAVLITFVTSKVSTALILAVILLIIQQADSNIIRPHLIKDTLDVKPFWVLVGILLGGGLFGIWGIILSIPALALIKTMLEDYFVYKNEKIKKSNTD